jgi:hypothetical protein
MISSLKMGDWGDCHLLLLNIQSFLRAVNRNRSGSDLLKFKEKLVNLRRTLHVLLLGKVKVVGESQVVPKCRPVAAIKRFSEVEKSGDRSASKCNQGHAWQTMRES